MKRFAIYILLLILSCWNTNASDNISNSYILLINSHSNNDSWSTGIINGFNNEITALGIDAVIDIESLNYERENDASQWAEKMARLLNAQDITPSAVIIIGDEAWMSYRQVVPENWKQIPLLLCGVKKNSMTIEEYLNDVPFTEKKTSLTTIVTKKLNASGILEQHEVVKTIDLMKQLMPGMTRLAFISDNSFAGAYANRTVRETVNSAFPDMEIDFLDGRRIDTDSLLQKLQISDHKTGLLLYSWFIDTNNIPYPKGYIYKAFHSNTSKPIFILTDLGMGNGDFIGGYFSESHLYGKQIADMLLEVLNGKQPRDIPFISSNEKATYHLNERDLHYFGIEKNLWPDNAVYYQTEIPFYKKYTSVIMLIVSLIIILLVIGLFLIRTNKLKEKLAQSLMFRRNLFSSLMIRTSETNDIVAIRKILEQSILHIQAGRISLYTYDTQPKSLQNELTLYLKNGEITVDRSVSIIKMSDSSYWPQFIKNKKILRVNSFYELDDAEAQNALTAVIGELLSFIFVPVTANNLPVGYLLVGYNKKHHWSDTEHEWMLSLSNIIATIIGQREIKKLKEEEFIKYKDLFDNMPIGFSRQRLITNKSGEPIDYQVIDMNPTYENQFDLDRKNYIGKYGTRIQPDLSKEDLYHYQEICLKKRVERIEYFNEKTKRFFSRVIYSPKDSEFAFFTSEITDQKIADANARRNQEKFSSIFTNLPIGALICNKSCVIIEANNAIVGMLGVDSKADLIGHDVSQNPILSNEIKEKIKRYETVTDSIVVDFSKLNESGYLKSKFNSVKYQNISGYCIFNENKEHAGYLLLMTDTTDKKETTDKMKNLESLFAYASERTNIGTAIWSPIKKEGYASPQWFSNLGTQNQQLRLEIDQYENIHPDDNKILLSQFEKLSNGEIDFFEENLRVRQDENDWKWIKQHILLKEFDPENNNIQFVGLNYNIDKEKQTEKELSDARIKAEESDRLKSAFLANMSHEIRTPLNAIIGFSELLANAEDEDEKKDYIHIIENNNELLLQLINDILDLSKIEAGTLDFIYSDVNMNELLLELQQIYRLRIDQKIEFKIEHEIPHCIIQTDRNRVYQILSNFISNAMKFTKEGGIYLGCELRGADVRFYVRDTGCGIPKEKATQAFERFVKLNNFAKGTGLGLSICKTIIEKLNGKIGVISDSGAGACFWFELPASKMVPVAKPAETENTEITPLSKPLISSTDKKHTLLVADDNESNYNLYRAMLKDYNLIHAWNGQEAVVLFDIHQPDLILMDINMPVLNGYEATAIIRQLSPGIPVIAVTAYASSEDEQQIMSKGFSAYMSKPINVNSLKKMISRFLD